MQVTNNINNLSNKNNKKSSRITTTAAAVTGGALTNLYIKNFYNNTIHPKITNGLQIQPDKSIGNELQAALKKSKLKNVDIVDISKLSDVTIKKNGLIETVYTVTDQIYDHIDKSQKKQFEKFIKPENIDKLLNGPNRQKQLTAMSEIFRQGKNAAFLPGINKILINTQKIGYAGFHEIGHAMNRNFSKIGKILQKMRIPATILTVILPFTAMLTKKNDNPTSKWQKTKKFIKDNVGKLTVLAFSPIVIEEIMASVKGQKLAKMCCSSKALKAVTKSHILSALSYISAAITSGVAAFAGNKVRDKIVDKLSDR